MSRDEVVDLVSKVLRVSRKKVADHSDLPGLWDSFSKIEVIVALEEKAGVGFTLEEISEISTVSELVARLEAKV